jgi:hypothetical protein
LPTFNTATLVGFGAVIASLEGFETVRDFVLGIAPDPLISLAVATNAPADMNLKSRPSYRSSGARHARPFGDLIRLRHPALIKSRGS